MVSIPPPGLGPRMAGQKRGFQVTGIMPLKVVYRCKHCKCRVVSKTDFRPYLGDEHGKKCPRRRLG